MSQFTGLTEIWTSFEDARSISASFFEKLPRLEDIYFHSTYLYDKFIYLPERSSSKSKPRIFCLGFEITMDQINQFNLEDQWPNFKVDSDCTRFAIQNLDRSIKKNNFIKSILYNEVASELDDFEMLEVMPRTFPKINKIIVGGPVTDQNRLLKFIKKFKIQIFKFEGTSLPRSFFEQLAESCPFISNLEVQAESELDILSGDFDFIFFKMKNLTHLCLSDYPLSLSAVARMLTEFKNLIWFDLKQTENYELLIFRDSHWHESGILIL